MSTEQMATSAHWASEFTWMNRCTEKGGAMKGKQLMASLLNSAAKSFSEGVKSFTLAINHLHLKPASVTQ